MGERRRDEGRRQKEYRLLCNDVRFSRASGQYNLILDGTGIAISAVGNGKLSVLGAGTADDGTLTVDG